MNTTFVNAFSDELEKLSSKRKRRRMLGLGAGLGALGIGGLLLSRGRRASSGIGKATMSAKDFVPKLKQQREALDALTRRAKKRLLEAKAERAHTESMVKKLNAEFSLDLSGKPILSMGERSARIRRQRLKKMKTQEATFVEFDKAMKDPSFLLKL